MTDILQQPQLWYWPVGTTQSALILTHKLIEQHDTRTDIAMDKTVYKIHITYTDQTYSALICCHCLVGMGASCVKLLNSSFVVEA